MHINISQGSCADKSRDPQSVLIQPGLLLLLKNPSVWADCLGKNTIGTSLFLIEAMGLCLLLNDQLLLLRLRIPEKHHGPVSP